MSHSLILYGNVLQLYIPLGGIIETEIYGITRKNIVKKKPKQY